MPIPHLPVARIVVVALLAAALETSAAVALAQDADPDGPKLDPVLQQLATQPLGRTRVIVEYAGTPDVRAITSRRGRALPRARHAPQVAEIDNRELASLAADPRVSRVMVDRPVVATLARTRANVGAAAAFPQLPWAGCGVGIAVIDSGLDGSLDDLRLSGDADVRERIVHFKDFTRDGVAGGAEVATDDYGHGTHVGGIIAGSGYGSNGARTGIAPCANLIGLRVLDADGFGYISDVIAALDYAVAVKDAFNIRVINISAASGVFESAWRDPLARAAKRAVDAGIVVVAAAGNLGTNEHGEPQYGGITSPGHAPWVLTVGASTHQGTARRSDDKVADFSSRGPTFLDFLAKPDVVAPGAGIESLLAPGSMLAASLSDYTLPGARDGSGRYLSMSGTSMAAPVVSGIVALLLEANPALTPNAVKGILQYTAQPLEGAPYLAQGSGLVNAAGALRLARFWDDTETGLGHASDVIEGERVPWSQHVIWGNFRVTGGVPLPGSNAWAPSTVWGALKTARGAPIVWGARTLDVSATAGRGSIVWATAGDENIVWSTGGRNNIVWATKNRSNIVWATGGRGNIVWATGGRNNIVWATRNRSNIVWATGGRSNIVWATGGRGNIVWATGGRNNIVWATAVAENLVWGNDCDGHDCARTVWGAEERDGTVWGTARSLEDIVSAASGGRNIVWATGGRGNIVWATGGRGNIVWATGGRGNIVWATGGRGNIVWATGGRSNIVWATSAEGQEVIWSAPPDPVVWPPDVPAAWSAGR